VRNNNGYKRTKKYQSARLIEILPTMLAGRKSDIAEIIISSSKMGELKPYQ
jgi:hypothetical protein